MQKFKVEYNESFPFTPSILKTNPSLYVLDKAWAADLYLIYKLEPKARVCISDTDRMRMFYRT
jgi:hypothetical protein